MYCVGDQNPPSTRKSGGLYLRFTFETKQAVNNQNSAKPLDKTNNLHFAIKHTTGRAHQQVGLMSPTVTADT